MKVSSAAEMRALDKAAAERFGLPEDLLMENASLAALRVFKTEFGVAGRRFSVLCGPGNNGGDGLALARHIHAEGGDAQVLLLGDPARLKGAARGNYERLTRLPAVSMRRLEAASEADETLACCDAVVDALLGTGLDREVTGLHAEVIHRINQSAKPVLSLDIPSGVHGDTGQVMGAAVRARWTVTFGLPKAGNLLQPGRDLGGRLHVAPISFPPCLHESLVMEINPPPALPRRPPHGHKGTFGQALVIAGAASYYGAPLFAAMSFLKAGGGYSRLAAPASMVPHLAAAGREVVFVPLQETASGSLSLDNLDRLLELAESQDVVILGPGLSLVHETQELVQRLVRGLTAPLILDGDGITALCTDLDILRARTAPTALTPHPGEMGRLLGVSAAQAEADRIASARRAAADLGACVVLKGASSLTARPDGRLRINLTGNSGMATAGSGDALTGAIAAAFCLGLPFEDAVDAGVFLHGLAGDLAAERLGEDGMTAGDILGSLPLAFKMTRETPAAVLAERNGIRGA